MRINSKEHKGSCSGFEKQINSSIYEMKLLITEALRYIDSIGTYPEEKRDNARLVISELLANALYHGNRNNSTKKIKLTIIPERKDNILIQVEDEGSGLNNKILRDKRRTAFKNRRSLDESGRGLLLVNHITGRVFTKQEGKTVCTKINMGRHGTK